MVRKNSCSFLTLTAIFFLSTVLVVAQKGNIGIGISTPHPSAQLHLGDDQGKGFKIPYTDTNAIYAFSNSFTPPYPIANGLLIFQKGAETYYYYDAKRAMWLPLSGLTGPTGPKGPTGLVGLTGPTGHRTKMRHGSGFPVKIAGDTCDSYYFDILTTNFYRFNCAFGFWQYVGGKYDGRIKGGMTLSTSSDSIQISPTGPVGSSNLIPINGLTLTIANKAGYTTFAFIRAWGTVRKETPNSDYNYAKFDFKNAFGELGMKQIVSMGPNGPSPDFNYDNVRWSIAIAMENPGTISVVGGQLIGKAGLGGVVVADGPGSDYQAHMEAIVVYVRLL